MPSNIPKDVYKYIMLHDMLKDSVNGETGTNDWGTDGLNLRTKEYEDSDCQKTLSAAGLFHLLPAILHIRFRQNNRNIHKLATQTGWISLKNGPTLSPRLMVFYFITISYYSIECERRFLWPCIRM
jgi:hypothetical protein